jgi:hypothetical protein
MKKSVNGIIVDMTAEEIAARQAEETAWANGAFDRALKEVRQKRNALLAETDHLALSDNTLTTEMTTYRQSLRDITNNVDDLDDINNITWPTKPGA